MKTLFATFLGLILSSSVALANLKNCEKLVGDYNCEFIGYADQLVKTELKVATDGESVLKILFKDAYPITVTVDGAFHPTTDAQVMGICDSEKKVVLTYKFENATGNTYLKPTADGGVIYQTGEDSNPSLVVTCKRK